MLLGGKLGPINWQLPASKRFEAEEFAAFLSLLPARLDGRALRHAVELRHASFRSPAPIRLLRQHGIAAVTAGDSAFPQITGQTGDFAYLRLMGTTARHSAGYTPDALALWSRRITALARGEPAGLSDVDQMAGIGPRDVFVYVIAGEKERNPMTAKAPAERLAQDGP